MVKIKAILKPNPAYEALNLSASPEEASAAAIGC